MSNQLGIGVQGSRGDTAAGSDTGNFSRQSLFKRLLSRITTIFATQFPATLHVSGGVKVEQDSGENEFIPGVGSGLISAATPAGYTKLYDQAVAGNSGFKASTPNTTGRAFYIRSVFAASVERGSEEAPVLTLEIRNANDVTVFHTPYTMSAIVKRKKIICPVDGKVYLKTDIATRLPWTIDIQEIAP